MQKFSELARVLTGRQSVKVLIAQFPKQRKLEDSWEEVSLVNPTLICLIGKVDGEGSRCIF